MSRVGFRYKDNLFDCKGYIERRDKEDGGLVDAAYLDCEGTGMSACAVIPHDKLAEYMQSVGYVCKKKKVKRTDEPIAWVVKLRNGRFAALDASGAPHAVDKVSTAWRGLTKYEADTLATAFVNNPVVKPLYRKAPK